VFVSIHANYGAPEMSGPEVYVHPEAGPGSRRLAGQIGSALGRLAGRYGGSEERRAAMAVLNPAAIGTRTAACLVEVDYLSNAGGERRLGDPNERATIGAAIASAIQAHLASGLAWDLSSAIAAVLPEVDRSSLSSNQKHRLRDMLTLLRNNPSADDHYLNGLDSELQRIGPRLTQQQFDIMIRNRVTEDLLQEQHWNTPQHIHQSLGLLDERIWHGIQYLARRAATDGAAMSAGLRQLKDWIAERQRDGGSVYSAYGEMQDRYEGRLGFVQPLDRATPDPYIIPSPSDYVGTGILNYIAVWGGWFARWAAWRAGVPMPAYQTFPHNAIAELEIRYDDGTGGVGTGFYIGPNKLLTNGHVFKNGAARATSVRVRLGKPPGIMWTTGGTTFPITAPLTNCHPRWAASEEAGFDLGVLRTPGLSPTQFFPLPTMCPADNQNIVVCGYAKFTADPVPVMQQGQYMDGGRITSASAEEYYFPMQSLPGGSGSPVFWPSHNGTVVAVLSGPRVVIGPSGPEMHPSENRGVMLTPAKNTWINSR
jgi:V8-like Glu-specific endopeptidase